MLSRAPFVSIVLSFMTGVLAVEFVLSGSPVYLIPLAAATVVLLFLYVINLLKKQMGIGILAVLFFLLSGALAVSIQNYQLSHDEQVFDGRNCLAYTAVVSSLPEKRVKSLRYEVQIKQFKTTDGWQTSNLKALVSIPSDSDVVPSPGNQILVYGTPGHPAPPLNPDEFDYALYLKNKGIVWVHYLQQGTFQITDHSEKGLSRLASWSISVSGWADQVFRRQIRDDDSYGLVKAMLLGRRDDLRSEQVDNYTISGTVHILSVSGMHVAIIFMVLSRLFGWVKQLKAGRLIYLFLIVSSLGFYALVTGLPPSVQRATLMCVIVVIADTFRRRQFSINTLAISALLILAIDPHALFDIGFQLSFLAMTGIFLFYKPMAGIWNPGNKVAVFLWEITMLAFAAQLATFPLSLFYFHQFPTYFWLVNPIVIFFTNILLPAAMVLLLVSLFPFPWLQYIADQAVHWSAYFTNISVVIPKCLPGYVLKNLYLDKFEVMLLYCLMLIVWYSLEIRELKMLKYGFTVTSLLLFYSLSQSIQQYYTPGAIIHSVPKHSVISYRKGNTLFIQSDSAFVNDEDAYDFRIANYAVNSGVLHTVYLTETKRTKADDPLFGKYANGDLVVWAGRVINRGAFSANRAINYQLVTEKEPSLRDVSTSVVLLGGEIRYRKADRWKEFLLANDIAFHDLAQSAYRIPE